MMKVFSKVLSAILVASMLFALSACAGAPKKESSQSQAEPQSSDANSPSSDADSAPADSIPLTFWFSLGGTSGEAVVALADNFNKSQSKYFVKAEYQGNYNDSLLKFISSPDDQRPDVIMVNELGTQKIMDTGDFLPIQQFIDAGDLDISGYQQNVMDAYKNDDGMFAFPFSITVPGITYNKEALEKAGVNPETDLATFAGFNEACEKIVSSGAASYGACIVNDAWHVEQMVAMMDTYLTDFENGRTGRVSELTSAKDGSLLNVLNVLKDFYTKPYSYVEANAGDARAEFCAGNIAMIITTVGNYGTMKETAGGLFTLGQSPMPAFEGSKGVPYPSGAALWVIDRGQEEKAAGVVEFIKFFATPEQQALFVLATGYLPINDEVLNNPDYKNYLENENPGTKKILDQFSKATRNAAIFGVDDQFRSAVQSEVDNIRMDSAYTAEQAVAVIAEKTNEAITLYNKTVS